MDIGHKIIRAEKQYRDIQYQIIDINSYIKAYDLGSDEKRLVLKQLDTLIKLSSIIQNRIKSYQKEVKNDDIIKVILEIKEIL